MALAACSKGGACHVCTSHMGPGSLPGWHTMPRASMMAEDPVLGWRK